MQLLFCIDAASGFVQNSMQPPHVILLKTECSVINS